LRKSTDSRSSSLASSTPATSAKRTCTPLSWWMRARLLPTDSSPPMPKPPWLAAMRRASHAHSPNSTSEGNSHDSISLRNVFSSAPSNRTPYCSSWPATAGSTRVATMRVRPSGSGALSLPSSSLLLTVTDSTRPSFRCCTNSL
jgi:hypothetical protein